MLRLLRNASLLGLALTATQAGAAETVLRDSRHIVRFIPSSPYPGVAWYNDATAACNTSGALGTYTSIPFVSSNQTACDKKAQEELNAAYATEADKGPASCYRATGTLETKTCGNKLVCGYSGCGYVPVTETVCHLTVFKSASFKYTPAFLVHSILYELPGNATHVTYNSDAMSGSTWETTLAGGYSSEATLKWLLGATYSSTTTYERVDRETISINAKSTDTFNFQADAPDHYQDQIVLWINPTLTRWVQCAGGGDVYEYGVTSNPYLGQQDWRDAAWMVFTAGELLHPSTVFDPVRKPFLDALALTPGQVDESILTLDPFFDEVTRTMRPTAALENDPDRFRNVQGGICPRNLVYPITDDHSYECTGSYSITNENTSTFNSNWKLNAQVKFLGMQPNIGISASYKRARTERTGHGNSAIIHLGTTTPGICIRGQLAIDTMFNVYVASTESYPCAQ